MILDLDLVPVLLVHHYLEIGKLWRFLMYNTNDWKGIFLNDLVDHPTCDVCGDGLLIFKK